MGPRFANSGALILSESWFAAFSHTSRICVTAVTRSSARGKSEAFAIPLTSSLTSDVVTSASEGFRVHSVTFGNGYGLCEAAKRVERKGQASATGPRLLPASHVDWHKLTS
ncbi:hypothetical protein BURKHO8Y_510032 [Burkholderia sp. 8Y]|nr:hypothetical protein BURKHO8Y_510032 [Burkholderia sp. 8Y]